MGHYMYSMQNNNNNNIVILVVDFFFKHKLKCIYYLLFLVNDHLMSCNNVLQTGAGYVGELGPKLLRRRSRN